MNANTITAAVIAAGIVAAIIGVVAITSAGTARKAPATTEPAPVVEPVAAPTAAPALTEEETRFIARMEAKARAKLLAEGRDPDTGELVTFPPKWEGGWIIISHVLADGGQDALQGATIHINTKSLWLRIDGGSAWFDIDSFQVATLATGEKIFVWQSAGIWAGMATTPLDATGAKALQIKNKRNGDIFNFKVVKQAD